MRYQPSLRADDRCELDRIWEVRCGEGLRALITGRPRRDGPLLMTSLESHPLVSPRPHPSPTGRVMTAPTRPGWGQVKPSAWGHFGLTQPRPAAFPDDVQHRFGTLHYAYLPSLDIVITCAPLPCAPAFPGSSAGRCSRDYYGHSVAIGLAPRRRSRGTSSSYVSSTT